MSTEEPQKAVDEDVALPVRPRPAATLILVRDTARGLEVFLMGRSPEAKSFRGAHVFPGGTVDAGDDIAQWADFTAAADAAASRLLNLESGGIAYLIAAIRECYEEAGLLLAEDFNGELAKIDTPQKIAMFSRQREQLNAGALSFQEFLDHHGLRPAIRCLAYLSHWITPLTLPRRFDTRFFVALAPEGQEPSHDCGETVSHIWIRPEDALSLQKAGNINLLRPTQNNLEFLARFSDSASLMHHLAQPRHVPATRPHAARGSKGPRNLLPQDDAYAEVVKLDPQGRGSASYDIIPGVPIQLSPRLRRITAPNPGYMTGPGTNTYLLGAGDEIAVIDPGPDRGDHLDRLIEEAKGSSGKGRVRWIFATHTHPDHSPGALRLKRLTGAAVLGLPPPAAGHQDISFQPDRALEHGERLAMGDCTLRVIHTPGHASNHLCYLFEEEKILFTGDHLMQGSTVVIGPPDGEMAVYLQSLRAVQREDIEYLAPGHGFLMDSHRSIIDALISHRLKREDKVLTALRQLGNASVEQLLPLVYDDIPVQIHPVAARSLLAHLIKLQAEGRAREHQGRWSGSPTA